MYEKDNNFTPIDCACGKIKQGEYIQQPEINKFVGTWEWTSGTEKFQIVISKQKLQCISWQGYDVEYYEDIAVGWHNYTKNGVAISSSMNNANRKFATWKDADKNSTLKGWIPIEQKYLSLSFTDPVKNKWGSATFTMVEGKTNEAQWELKEIDDGDIRLVSPNAPKTPKGWSVPTNVVMKKVK